MVSTGKYANVLPKIGAQRSLMLTNSKLRALAESSDLAQFVNQLRDTVYGERVAKIVQPNSRKFERAFREDLIEVNKKIIQNAPKETREFLESYIVKLRVQNLKTLIKAIAIGQSYAEKMSRVYLSAEETSNRIIEESAQEATLKEFIEHYKKFEFYDALLSGFNFYEKTGSTQAFDICIDKYFFDKNYEAFQKLPAKEKRHAVFYASFESDRFTLMTILRGKLLDYDANWLKDAIPSKHYKLSKKIIDTILEAPNFDHAIDEILKSLYGKYFVKKENPDQTLAIAEKAFDREIFKHAQVSRIKEIFNIESTLGFLAQKQFEVHNLVVASICVEASWPPEKIQQAMFLFS